MFWLSALAVVLTFGIIPLDYAASPDAQRELLIGGGAILAILFLGRRHFEYAAVPLAGPAYLFWETYVLDKQVPDETCAVIAGAVLFGIIAGFLVSPAERARRWIRVRLFSRGRPSTPHSPVPSSWPAWSWSAILARSDPPSSSWRGQACEGR